MKRSAISVSLAFLLTGASAAHSLGAENTHYSGSFVCGSDEYVTNWIVSNDGSDSAQVKLFYYQIGGYRSYRLDLTKHGDQLIDDNGIPRIFINNIGDSSSAQWIKGAPANNCGIAVVDKTVSPKEFYDQLFTQLETQEPNDELALQIQDQLRSRPAIAALPELDQDSYSAKADQLVQRFWRAYAQNLDNSLKALPVDTETEQSQAKARIDELLGPSLSLSSKDVVFENLKSGLTNVADRIADTDTNPADVLGTKDSNVICKRFEVLNQAQRYFLFEKAALAVGLPFDYWSRAMAENFLEVTRSCKAISRDYAEHLSKNWANIEARQELFKVLRAEQKRILALPATMETITTTGLLKVDENKLNLNYSDRQFLDRFFGQRLDSKRNELLTTVLKNNVTDKAKLITFDDVDSIKGISETCNALNKVYYTNATHQTLVKNSCDTAMAEIISVQKAEAMKQVEAAFSAIKPDMGGAKEARELCSSFSSTLLYKAANDVDKLCRSQLSQLREKEDQYLCDAAITNSGVDKDFLETTLAVNLIQEQRNVPLKDVICNTAKRNLQVTIASTGFWMWKSYTLSLKEPTSEKPYEFDLVDNSDNGSDWRIEISSDETKARIPFREDIVSACIAFPESCR